MKREIKFRGLKIDTNEWVYGLLVNNLWGYSENSPFAGQNFCEIITSGECDDYEDMQEKELNITVVPKSVGQFTGLKDKNGVEIYEGDIVEDFRNHTEMLRYWRCRFNNGSFNFWNRNSQMRDVATDLFKVVGNIYENPLVDC